MAVRPINQLEHSFSNLQNPQAAAPFDMDNNRALNATEAQVFHAAAHGRVKAPDGFEAAVELAGGAKLKVTEYLAPDSRDVLWGTYSKGAFRSPEMGEGHCLTKWVSPDYSSEMNALEVAFRFDSVPMAKMDEIESASLVIARKDAWTTHPVLTARLDAVTTEKRTVYQCGGGSYELPEMKTLVSVLDRGQLRALAGDQGLEMVLKMKLRGQKEPVYINNVGGNGNFYLPPSEFTPSGLP